MLLLPFIATAQPPGGEAKTVEELIPLMNQYCGACHQVPPPYLLPKRSWPRVIDSMAELAKNRTGAEFIPEEHLHHIKALYYGSSPEELPVLPYIDQPHPSMSFTASDLGEPSMIPQILNIQAVNLDGRQQPQFLVSDGERRQLLLLEPAQNIKTKKRSETKENSEAKKNDSDYWQETVLADIEIPITTQVVDYTGDGRDDILVADLGEFPPNGALAGKIFLLQQEPDGSFTKHLLMYQMGRVTDMRALDLDDDGDLDLAVAVFGGGDVGEVFWMENRGKEPRRKHDLLGLSGALNITPVDLNGDGLMDLVTLVAQEHETVVAFINQGKGEFERLDIASAPHPMFGSTSMVVADLDQDGDPDIVFANGDAFDTQNDPKPYHGVQWLENKGDLQFAGYDIGRFYGAANVAVGDMDGDGDLDVVASSWVNDWEDERRQSLIWFENDGKQQFQPRPISSDYRGLVPLELVDITGNGRLDIVTAAFRMDILKEYMSTEPNSNTLDTSAMEKVDRPPSSRLLLFENQSVE